MRKKGRRSRRRGRFICPECNRPTSAMIGGSCLRCAYGDMDLARIPHQKQLTLAEYYAHNRAYDFGV
jgi:NMD protein affecting ribosome stability and mRNA decay